MQHRPTEIAHHTLDATPHIQREIQVIHPHQRKPRYPFAKFRRYGERPLPRLLSHPLRHPPIHARAERLHQIVSQRRAPLPRHMGNAKRRVQPHPEKLLQNRRKQHRIPIIQQVIQPRSSSLPRKIRLPHTAAKRIPKQLRADRLLVRLPAPSRLVQELERDIPRREKLRQRVLIATLRIHRLLPKPGQRLRIQLQQRPTEQRIRRAIRWQHQTRRLEIFANNQSHPVLRRLQKQIAMNTRRETRDNDRRHILQRQRFVLLPRHLASQLPILATKRTLWRIDADNMKTHTG